MLRLAAIIALAAFYLGCNSTTKQYGGDDHSGKHKIDSLPTTIIQPKTQTQEPVSVEDSINIKGKNKEP